VSHALKKRLDQGLTFDSLESLSKKGIFFTCLINFILWESSMLQGTYFIKSIPG